MNPFDFLNISCIDSVKCPENKNPLFTSLRLLPVEKSGIIVKNEIFFLKKIFTKTFHKSIIDMFSSIFCVVDKILTPRLPSEISKNIQISPDFFELALLSGRKPPKT